MIILSFPYSVVTFRLLLNIVLRNGFQLKNRKNFAVCLSRMKIHDFHKKRLVRSAIALPQFWNVTVNLCEAYLRPSLWYQILVFGTWNVHVYILSKQIKPGFFQTRHFWIWLIKLALIMNVQQVRHLIREVEKVPLLYRPKNPRYGDRECRKAAFAEIGKVLGINGEFTIKLLIRFNL